LTHRKSSGIQPHFYFRPPTDCLGGSTEDPMLKASHIAAAPSATTGRFDRPSDWLPVGAFGYSGVACPNMWSERRSRLKPE
jgi:hypothetical protein